MRRSPGSSVSEPSAPVWAVCCADSFTTGSIDSTMPTRVPPIRISLLLPRRAAFGTSTETRVDGHERQSVVRVVGEEDGDDHDQRRDRPDHRRRGCERGCWALAAASWALQKRKSRRSCAAWSARRAEAAQGRRRALAAVAPCRSCRPCRRGRDPRASCPAGRGCRRAGPGSPRGSAGRSGSCGRPGRARSDRAVCSRASFALTAAGARCDSRCRGVESGNSALGLPGSQT